MDERPSEEPTPRPIDRGYESARLGIDTMGRALLPANRKRTRTLHRTGPPEKRRIAGAGQGRDGRGEPR